MKVKSLFGDRKFYKMVLFILLPIVIQNSITSFVSLFDNIMVGALGTEQMSGVAIVNQLMFVFNISIFGAVSGAGIYAAQFFGQGDMEGVRNSFRFKLLICFAILTMGIGILIWHGDFLVNAFLHDGSQSGDIALTLEYGKQYLQIMIVGLLPFVLVQVYAGTLRETGETFFPMVASIVAVIVNLIFNYILIFGKFGAPVLGVRGAAIATVLSRFVECFIVILWTHLHRHKFEFIQGIYRTLLIPRELVKQITFKGAPLLINEILWSAGMTFLLQCYSVRGLSVVAGMNISTTIGNLFNVVFISMGSAVAIIVGQKLGAGRFDEARKMAYQLIFFSVLSCFGIGLIMFATAPLFPEIYNTTDEVRVLATWFIRILAMAMPLQAFLHSTYFTLRSGGKTLITFLYDSVYVWVITIPLAFFLSRYTGIHIIPVYFMCQMIDILKCIIGLVLLRKGVWIQNIVETKQ